MKKIAIVLLASVICSCNTKDSKETAETNGEPETIEDTVAASSTAPLVFNPESKLYVWKSDYDYTKTKNPSVNPAIINADSLIRGLNELNEKILLEKVNVSGDTIYTRIKDAAQLTEGLGCSGAEMYLADVVLNLTEVPGIKYVNIQLKEGSHMQPGTWSKENFAKYKPVN